LPFPALAGLRARPVWMAGLWKRGGVLAAAIETPFTASVLPSVLNNIFLLFIDLSFLDLEMIFLPKSLR